MAKSKKNNDEYEHRSGMAAVQDLVPGLRQLMYTGTGRACH